MKHLKKYQIFFEDIQIDPSDLPDEKRAKEGVNDQQKYLKDYKTLKPKIEQLYSSTSNAIEIEEGLKKIMPEKDESNPYLTDYLRICRLQKEIEDGRKSSVEDKAKMDDFSQQQKLATTKDEQSSIGEKIGEIEDRSSTYEQLIAKKSQELQKLLIEHKKKMADIEKEIKQDIKEIENK